jgi:hypothetical protein
MVDENVQVYEDGATTPEMVTWQLWFYFKST